MTNNPTIDGVSRELLKDLVKLASRNVRSAWSGSVCEEARALLDAHSNDLREHCKQCAEVVKTWPEWKRNCLGGAPAVERQDICGKHSGDSCKTCGGSGMVNDGELTHSAGGILYENGPIQCMKDCPDCPDEPEVSALQSTIAQLQARIAELESGKGEPVAYQWRCKTTVDGSQWRHWVDCEREDYDRTIANPGASSRGIIREARKLYTAPPAPVAVVPDGWKLVPIEATKPMLRAFIAGGCSRSSYRDMIAAAPISLDATVELTGAKP